MTAYERLFNLGFCGQTLYFANINGSYVVLGRNAVDLGAALGIVVRKETFPGQHHGELHCHTLRIPEHLIEIYIPKMVKSLNWTEVVLITNFHVLEKYHQIMQGDRVVVSDADLDEMVNLPKSNSIKSVPNPNRVGTRDAYVAYL
jgi:hypothetical protein